MKRLWEGRGLDGSAVQFLQTTYAAELADGSLGPGRLQALDKRLYSAVRRELEQEVPKRSVEQLFREKLSDPSQERAYQRRATLAAKILGTDIVEATKFLGTLRLDRLKPAVGKHTDIENSRRASPQRREVT